MTFIGFAAIVLSLRQTLGHKLSRFDVLLARVYMEEFGLMISAGALLPLLLMIWDFSPSMVWRVSSGLAALPAPCICLDLPCAQTGSYRRTHAFLCTFECLDRFID